MVRKEISPPPASKGRPKPSSRYQQNSRGRPRETHLGAKPSAKEILVPDFGPDKSERELRIIVKFTGCVLKHHCQQIWVCAKGRLGYRRKEESESWPGYTDAVLQSLLENLRKESDDVVLSSLSTPYDEYKCLLYLAYPWLQEVETMSESKPQGAPGMWTWSFKRPSVRPTGRFSIWPV